MKKDMKRLNFERYAERLAKAKVFLEDHPIDFDEKDLENLVEEFSIKLRERYKEESKNNYGIINYK